MTLVIRDGVALAPLTTLELGGPARHFVEADDDAAVVEALRWAEARGLPVAILGGGSNLVVADAGFDGLVVRIGSRGRRFEPAGGEVVVTAAAGEPWDALVAEAVGRDLGGLECLSGIPGLVGATPIQNVGAYGQEVADTIRAVRVVERGSWQIRELPPAACGFGYRDSAFKRDPGRFVVLAVSFGLRPGAPPALRYRELCDSLAGNARPTLAETRATVLALRGKKSMLVTAGDPNRRSVGSFFTNPIVAADQADALAGGAPSMPRWPAADGRVKLSAGWLIEQSGVRKGSRRGAVGISSAHALALVHHGGGSTAALLALAHEVAGAVHARFGVTLVPEPTFLGLSWDAGRAPAETGSRG
ncbi:MAG TPA: UDP-N-acetylmuramate dehydrogenase [Polyangia bacterium]|nr:UDP-N-acetylmuramate dehydrogenase [Polyangia bacterium]